MNWPSRRAATFFFGVATFLIGASALLVDDQTGEHVEKDERMAVTATLSLEETSLLFQQSTVCHVQIRNESGAALTNVNPQNQVGAANLRVTDLASGETTVFAARKKGGMPAGGFRLPAGQSRGADFLLSDVFEFPRPGEYELRAHYEWDGAQEVLSPPVKLTLRPANPRSLQVVGSEGSLGAVFYGAWVNRIEGAKPKYELWLAKMATGGKPQVRTATYLADVLDVVQPCVSVPPNAAPMVQWVAWIEGSELQFVAQVGAEASGKQAMKLAAEGLRLIPPLFENPLGKGESIPGADVLLYEEGIEGRDGRLHMVRISPTGKTSLEHSMDFPGAAPRWAKSAYTAQLDRFSFFLRRAEQGLELRQAAWSASRRPGEVNDLCRWTGRFVASDCVLSAADDVFGAVLVDTGERGSTRYVLHRWVFAAPDKFGQLDPTQVAWDKPTDIDHTVLRLNDSGEPFALVRTNPKAPQWYFIDSGGRVRALADPDAVIQLPADVLFRPGLEPTILYTDPGRGFKFAKPM